jgi:hypothetical protein
LLQATHGQEPAWGDLHKLASGGDSVGAETHERGRIRRKGLRRQTTLSLRELARRLKPILWVDPVLRQILSNGALGQVVQLPESRAERLAEPEARSSKAKASLQSRSSDADAAARGLACPLAR